MKLIDVPNANPWRNMLSAGQPSRAQFEAAAGAGFTTVIDLRCAGEFDEFDEPAVVAALGMEYQRIPVNGAAGITAENARALQAALRAAPGPVLCHCGSGNRVGGLVALGEWLDGADAETAVAAGRAAGMIGLEPHLRALMA